MGNTATIGGAVSSGVRHLTRTGLRRAASVALIPVLLVECQIGPPSRGPYVPEVAGVVKATEDAGNGQTRFVLANGQKFTVDRANGKSFDSVYEAGQDVGDLLLGGHAGSRPWLALIPPGTDFASYLPPGCYALTSRGTDLGDSVQTDVGLLLKKAQTFNTSFYPKVPGGWPPTASPGMRYEGSPQEFCLNEEGLLTAAR